MTKKTTSRTSDQAVLTAALREDLHAFIHKAFSIVSPGETYNDNWHIQTLAWHLQQCYERKITRLIVTLPPRHLKSHCVSVAFPAWVLGKDPTRKIIVASYSQELAKNHAMKCRTLMESSIYQKTFPGMEIHPKKCTETEVMTIKMGFRLSTSVGGTLTGLGGNIIIVDDPIKPIDATSEAQRKAVNEWYDSTLYSRLDNKATDVIIVVMQRAHMDDLVGHVLAKQEKWVVVDIPAIADEPASYRIGENEFHHRAPGDVLDPVREPLTVLQQTKTTLGSYHFSAQYQQTPVPPGGTLFHWEWFQHYDELPKPEEFNCIVQSWDFASSLGDNCSYSACSTWGFTGDRYFLIDVYRARLEYPALKQRVLDLAAKHMVDAILIEKASLGIPIYQDLVGGQRLNMWHYTPKLDKQTRATAQTAKVEAGRVYLPTSASWLKDFRFEVLAFPAGKFDDQVDTMVAVLEHGDTLRQRVDANGRYHALRTTNSPRPGLGPIGGGRFYGVGGPMSY
jgi:predicted phage terminase large subunit-like protein